VLPIARIAQAASIENSQILNLSATDDDMKDPDLCLKETTSPATENTGSAKSFNR
jgi:hypothetical protein